MSKILVTGGSGFIGAKIVESLFKKGHQVRVYDNFSRGNKARLGHIINEIEIIEGDIRDVDLFTKSSKHIDTLIHLAYVNGTETFYKNPTLVLDVAIEGLISIKEAIRNNEIPDLILASSSEVYQSPNVYPTPEDIAFSIPSLGNPRYSYGLGKILQEFFLYHSDIGLDCLTIFRPHNIYGFDMGNQHVIPQLFSKALIAKKNNLQYLELQGDGSQTRSFCHINDFIIAFDIIFKNRKGKEVFNIGTTDEVSIKHLALEILKTLNLDIKLSFVDLPNGGTIRRVPDISKIEDLGFKQTVSLQAGLIDYYQKLMGE